MIKPTARKTILLLISDKLVRSVAQEALEAEGYCVFPVGDLGSAVDRLKTIRPHLLIASHHLSSMTGHDAARHLRARCPQMRVLISSCLLDDDRLEHRAALEGFEVFPKPCSASDFVAKVRAILNASEAEPGRSAVAMG
ncbi:MAG: response regulator transcription factor [Acidobacteriia bacterium]|nr:response regulator transcription factor [Terriglobia bacterium]